MCEEREIEEKSIEWYEGLNDGLLLAYNLLDNNPTHEALIVIDVAIKHFGCEYQEKKNLAFADRHRSELNDINAELAEVSHN